MPCLLILPCLVSFKLSSTSLAAPTGAASMPWPLKDPFLLGGFKDCWLPVGLSDISSSSLAAAFRSDSNVCLIDPFRRKFGVAEGLGASPLRPTAGLFAFPSVSIGVEPFLLASPGLAGTLLFSSVGNPNSFLLELGLAWILASLEDSSRSLLIEGRRVSDGSTTDFLSEPLLVKVEDPLSSSLVFKVFLGRGWVGGIAFSSSFLRNDGRRARPAAFAVAWEEWPVSFDLEIEMIKSFCKILPRDDDDDDGDVMMMMIIMAYQRGWDTCVPTPKMAYFSVFKAFLFLKYFKNNLGLIQSSFNP